MRSRLSCTSCNFGAMLTPLPRSGMLTLAGVASSKGFPVIGFNLMGRALCELATLAFRPVVPALCANETGTEARRLGSAGSSFFALSFWKATKSE